MAVNEDESQSDITSAEEPESSVRNSQKPKQQILEVQDNIQYVVGEERQVSSMIREATDVKESNIAINDSERFLVVGHHASKVKKKLTTLPLQH